MTDLSEYMTPEEFVSLGPAAQRAVWRAHAEDRVGAVPWSPRGTTLVYNRAQVLALLDETEATLRG
jgi:hypothetical protein